MAEQGLERWDSVFANLRETLNIYVNLGDRDMVGRIFNELTSAFKRSGRFEEATETARRGLAHLEADVSADRARLLASLAQAHSNAARYEQAHEALREALNIASQLSDPQLEVTCQPGFDPRMFVGGVVVSVKLLEQCGCRPNSVK